MSRFNEPLEAAKSPEEMRAAIFKHSCFDSLTRQVLDVANYSGMSAEDKYTVLAYHALVDRQKTRELVLQNADVATKKFLA